MADRPEQPAGTADSEEQWRTAGDRIQTLLDSCAASGAAAYERAQQLVREVVGLYGAGLERIMSELSAEPGSGTDLAERLATDDLVASLLLVHGLHPHDVHRRVSDALDRVRPYLGSHGGDVDLLEVADGPDGAVLRLAFKGSCKSCPSSAVTLELAVEDAVRAAAPEISSIEVVTAEPKSGPSVIPTESLLAHVHSNGHGTTRGIRRPSWQSSGAAKSPVSSSPRPRSWRAASTTRRSPTATIARFVTTRWPVRNCTVRCCAVRAVRRISTPCMPEPVCPRGRDTTWTRFRS